MNVTGQVAVPLFRATLAHRTAAPSLNVTVPAFGTGVTVAVRMTGCPIKGAATELESVVVVVASASCGPGRTPDASGMFVNGRTAIGIGDAVIANDCVTGKAAA